MKQIKNIRLWPLLPLVFLLAACQSTSSTQSVKLFGTVQLTPYSTLTQTLTATVTSVSLNAPTATVQPTETSTPIVYVLKANDTLWTIAAKAGLTMSQIKAVNPNINPYSLNSVSTTPELPTVTAIPVTVSSPHCTPSLSGGLYCFAIVKNNQSFVVQNLTAQFTLTNTQSGEKQSTVASTPLSHLGTGGDLPLFAYFQPPVPGAYQIDAQLLTALPTSSNDAQYVQIKIISSNVTISTDGYSALAKGLVSSAANATRFWMAAVAYDAQGNVVGVRQESKQGTLTPESSIDFSFYVYSIAGKIDHVDLFGEAKP